VRELLALVGLDPNHANRYPHQFSGGQRQRICIARALALDPKVLVCDEPVSALDVSVQAQIINLLKSLQERLGLAYIFVAHDLSVVRQVADRIAVMYLGEIVESGDEEEVLLHPSHPYTQALVSALPTADDAGNVTGSRIVLSGDLPNPANPPSGCRFRTRCWMAQAICAEEKPALIDRGTGRPAACHFVSPAVPA
jgi:oligopeptide transport system ATP-binding protein